MRWRPSANWSDDVGLEQPWSDKAYQDLRKVIELGGVRLDPIYEAKCVPFLLPGDLFWCVGIRATV